ncbi:MAG: anti-sigma factor family protein [Pirellulales bacterium]
MRDQMLGYLLGALDEDETREVRQLIESQPEIQDEFNRLKKHIDNLENSWDDIPAPSGLASKTCGLLDDPIAAQAMLSSSESPLEDSIDDRPAPKNPRFFESITSGPSRFTLLDSLVALGACLAAAAIFLPALAGSRMLANQLQCENNLRQVGVALQQSAYGSPLNEYPTITAEGPFSAAGTFGPKLIAEGYLPNEKMLSCVSNPREDSSKPFPSDQQLALANQKELSELHARLDSVYNYNLGMQESGKISPPQSKGRAHYPLASDVVFVNNGPIRDHSVSTMDHGGRGVNILYDDGSVRFLNIEEAPYFFRQYFINDDGVVEPGLSEEDAVLGSGTSNRFRSSE